MAQLVIPSLSELKLVFPDAVFDLYQQMKSHDSLSFQAVGNQDVLYSVNVKKQAGFLTQFLIETIDPDKGVLELDDDKWCCELKGITSEAFLLPGNVEGVTNDVMGDDNMDKQELAVLANTTEKDLPTPLDVTTEGVVSMLETESIASPRPHSEDTEMMVPPSSPGMVNIMSPIPSAVTPLEDINMVIKENDIEAGGEAESFTDSAAEPLEDANQGTLDTLEDPQGDAAVKHEKQEVEPDVTEVVISKNKKVTVHYKDTTEVYREAQVYKEDKTVQSEVNELTAVETPSEDMEGTDDYSLDMTLSEAAMAVDKAKEALRDYMEMKAEKKYIDPCSKIGKFPIFMEGDKYKCHICGMLLIKKHYLVTHMRYVHKLCVRDPLSILQCPHCPQTFIRRNRLDEHVAHKHTVEKKHKCDITGCEMAFKTIYNLRDHKRIYHYHMLRYACDICSKQYENPNTAERHRKQCAAKDPEKYGVKTADDLKNPNWMPIDELFIQEPIPRHNRMAKRTRVQQIKSENLKKNLTRVKVEYKENTNSDNRDINTENTHIDDNKADKATGSDVALQSDKLQLSPNADRASENEKEIQVKREDEKTCSKRKLNISLSEGEISNDDTPGKRRMLAKSEDDEFRKSGRLVKRERRDYNRMAEGEDEHTSMEQKSTESSSKSTTKQIPMKQLMKYIKNKKVSNIAKKEHTSVQRTRHHKDSEREVVQKTNQKNRLEEFSHIKLEPLCFQITGVLNVSEVYTIEQEELRRRMYGTESLNLVTLMSFLRSSTCSKIVELKKQLIEAGFDVPKQTAVTSSFTKLCEGEIADVVSDFKILQEKYFSHTKIQKSLLRQILTSSHEKSDFSSWLNHTGVLLKAFQQLLPNHLTEFDHMTHGFAKPVFLLLITLYRSVYTGASTELGSENLRQSYDVEEPKGINKGSPVKNKEGIFVVTSTLSVQSKSYSVSIEELERRSELPEKMPLTLLHDYLHKGKHNFDDFMKECADMGLILHKCNKALVKSSFSRIIEAEGNKLCTDFELLFDDHVELEDVVRDLIKKVTIESEKGQFAIMLDSVSKVSPLFENALHTQYKDFDLVTHGIGGQLTEFVWSVFIKVISQCKEFCRD